MSGDTVVPLGNEPIPPEPPPPPSRMGRVHSLSIATMAISALIGTASTFLFVTVGWQGAARRAVIVAIVLAALMFIASAFIAVLSAARDTYTTQRPRQN